MKYSSVQVTTKFPYLKERKSVKNITKLYVDTFGAWIFDLIKKCKKNSNCNTKNSELMILFFFTKKVLLNNIKI